MEYHNFSPYNLKNSNGRISSGKLLSLKFEISSSELFRYFIRYCATLGYSFGQMVSPLMKWISDRIQGSKLKVEILNTLSQELSVASGVLQGSALSLILFLCFSNAIKYSTFLLFSDDLKIFRNIKCYKDCELLQRNLNSVSTRCKQNEIKFSITKCQLMRFQSWITVCLQLQSRE